MTITPLTENNIIFVKMIEKDGVPYSWYVFLKGNDMRVYNNYVDGKTTADEYAVSMLPKAVQRFISKRNAYLGDVDVWKDEEYRHYTYR